MHRSRTQERRRPGASPNVISRWRRLCSRRTSRWPSSVAVEGAVEAHRRARQVYAENLEQHGAQCAAPGKLRKGRSRSRIPQARPPRPEEGQRHGISKPNQRRVSAVDSWGTFRVRKLTKNQYRTLTTARNSRSLLTSYRFIMRGCRSSGACEKIPSTHSCKRGFDGRHLERRIRELGEADLGLKSWGKNGLPPDGLVPVSRFT